jgi:metal-dependent hydrolase (beta-lactamase superfamily II)
LKQQINKDIYWVGALEWSKEHFHGHELSIRHGTSYNAYFIDDEKKVLIDLVRASQYEDLVRHIEEHCPVEKLDILIINHAEPDHASSLPMLLARNPNLEIYVSRGGKLQASKRSKSLKPATASQSAKEPCSSSKPRCCTGQIQCSPIAPKKKHCFLLMRSDSILPASNALPIW